MTSQVLIIGASVRAAAESALRAGLEPFAIDLFGDRDLRDVARSRVSIHYPADLPLLAETFPDAPFLYTGALENAPAVLTELRRRRTLWGNNPAVITRVRDPFRMQSFLAESGFLTVPLLRHDNPPAEPGNWLIKPYLSGHGFGIRAAAGNPVNDAEYFQQKLQGEPVGAAFIANGTECRLIGVHRQLAGLPESCSESFRFCGASAPAEPDGDTLHAISQIGSSLTRMAGLTGLFGCDFIVNSNGPYLLEVNPRYTASMELWEELLDRSLVGDHVRACREGLLPETAGFLADRRALKFILYAPEATIVPKGLEDSVREIPGCRLADLPETGSAIEPDHPVCTLLVAAGSQEELDSRWDAGIQSVGQSCAWSNQMRKFFDRKQFAPNCSKIT